MHTVNVRTVNVRTSDAARASPAVLPAFARHVRLCTVCTIGKSIQILYEGRLEYLAARGFSITAACAPSEDDDDIRSRGLELRTFALTRAITPMQDLRT